MSKAPGVQPYRWLAEHFDRVFGGYRKFIEAAHRTMKRRKAWCDCEWFVQEGRLWRRHTERVEEVCWTADEIHDVLTAAGFTQVQLWDATPFFKGDGITTEGCRSFVLARKRHQARC